VPDWKQIVCEKLGHLPLNSRRQDDVIEELAQQLESTYEEAIATGASEPEATRHSLAQFSNWEKLRREVFQSVEGSQLPIWEQNGIFAPRRLPVWIALAVALVFLALPSFRKALQILPLSRQVDAWDATAFSAQALQRIERTGDKQKYARTLAYVALHSPDDHQAVLAAEKAIALDPQLTWVCAQMSHATYLVPGHDPKPWIDRLKAWDPDNAYIYLLEADAIVYVDRETRWARFNAANGELRRALAAEPRWRIPMEKTFSAPRTDTYIDRHFLLDRDVLLERGLDRPAILALAVSSAQLPNFFMLETYADHLRLEVGEGAERAGHAESALAAYQSVASFGQKLQAGYMPLERTFSAKLREKAYQKMIPLLRREGRNREAGVVEFVLAAARTEDSGEAKLHVSALQSPAFRSGQLVLFSGLFRAVFAIAAALWLIFVALLRAKPNLSSSMNWLASRLGWAPVMLPICCLLLVTSFFPYSRSIADYSAAGQLFETYGSFFAGLGSLRLDAILDVWIDHMFWPLIWCAVILVLSAICFRYAASRHTGQSGVE
jgi:hypothetical protein